MCKLALALLVCFFSGHSWSKTTTFPFMGRFFTLVSPDKTPTQNRPLVVLLHGCKQDAEMIRVGTQLEKEAAQKGFYLLVPEQPTAYNWDKCWNWFHPFHQSRLAANEMGQIITTMEALFYQWPIDRNQVIVTGISAGGALAHNLTVCYPDYFSGSAIHSGLTFKSAESMDEATTVLTSTTQKSPEYLGQKAFACSQNVKQKLKNILIIHGAEDKRVPLFHSELMSKTHEVWRDYLDDGRRNDSVKVESSENSKKYPHGYSVTQTDRLSGSFKERTLVIHGLGHAWAGGVKFSENFDPKAPSSTNFILDYFKLIK